MKAIVFKKYGSAEVLQLQELDKPVPAENEILIKVHTSTVSVVDCIFREGKSLFARSFTGFTKPKYQIPGSDLAGEVVATGKNVKKFKEGDRIFGSTNTSFGAHSEYTCQPEESALAVIPPDMTYEEAAAVPYGFLTALPFLRDTADIQKRQKILINGASGGIGCYAVQLAKYYGAEVTGVVSTSNLDLVKALGADKVIDYTREDFTRNGETYDIIFDTVGKSSFSRCQKSLKEGGLYLTAAISVRILFNMLRTSLSHGKKAVITFTGLRNPSEKRQDLDFFKELLAEGKIKPVIDKSFSLEEIAVAHRHVESGHKRGTVVITVINE